ncbi:MFS transporter [Brucella intermedia]|uniref:MFS transporter n=1 Tax=Brucella intermedia TaxID=94625 RepID=UPI00224B745E|nr:MFS transporter [Brucella intermedia]
MNPNTNAQLEQRAVNSSGDARRWLALSILLTGAFLPVLDFNVVNLALPAIRQGLGATSSDIQFVISAYATSYAIFLITGGRLGDWLGRKPMFMLGVAGFTLASILCGMAWSPRILIVGRILQGLTATVMAPQVLASIRILFPPSEQETALGIYGATFGLANILGQILGGVLVSAHPFGFTWQTIFLINVPIGIFAFLGSLFFLSDSKSDAAQKLDIGGVVLLSFALGLLIYPLIGGRDLGWPKWIWMMLAASAITIVAFISYESRLKARGGAPLVNLSLFRQPRFSVGIVMALAFYMLSAFYLTYSFYLQGGLRLTPLEAGLFMLPFGFGYFASSFAAPAIMRRFGPRALTLGFAIQVFGFGALALEVASGFSGYMQLSLAVAGIGFGIVMPSVIKAVIGDIEQRHVGLASGIVISTFQVGAALGIALVGSVYFSMLGTATDLTSHAHAFAIALCCNAALLALGAACSLWL